MWPVYYPDETTQYFFFELIEEARRRNKEWPMLPHLFGAILQRCFPDEPVGNHSYLGETQPTDRLGDFLIGKTLFHVAIQPHMDLYLRCQRNLDAGYAVYLLVPDRMALAVQQNAEFVAPGQITVVSVESFVGQMIDERTVFGKGDRDAELRALLETYNRRVAAIEPDRLLRIDLPPNIRKHELIDGQAAPRDTAP